MTWHNDYDKHSNIAKIVENLNDVIICALKQWYFSAVSTLYRYHQNFYVIITVYFLSSPPSVPSPLYCVTPISQITNWTLITVVILLMANI